MRVEHVMSQGRGSFGQFYQILLQEDIFILKAGEQRSHIRNQYLFLGHRLLVTFQLKVDVVGQQLFEGN